MNYVHMYKLFNVCIYIESCLNADIKETRYIFYQQYEMNF